MGVTQNVTSHKDAQRAPYSFASGLPPGPEALDTLGGSDVIARQATIDQRLRGRPIEATEFAPLDGGWLARVRASRAEDDASRTPEPRASHMIEPQLPSILAGPADDDSVLALWRRRPRREYGAACWMRRLGAVNGGMNDGVAEIQITCIRPLWRRSATRLSANGCPPRA